MERYICPSILIFLALLLVYFSIRETRCAKCGTWFALEETLVADRRFVYKCRECEYQWTQNQARLTPANVVRETVDAILKFVHEIVFRP